MTLIEAMGFDELITQVPRLAHSTLLQSKGTLDEQFVADLERALPIAYNSDILYQNVLTQILGQFNNDFAVKMIEQLKSPLVKKMHALEEQTSTPEGQTAFRSYLDTKPEVAATRLKLSERLDASTKTSEFTINLQAAMFRGIFFAVDPLLEPGVRMGKERLEMTIDRIKDSLKDSTESLTRLNYQFAYRSVSDSDLSAYVDMYDSAASQWAIKTLNGAFLNALGESGEKMGILMMSYSLPETP